MSPLVEVVMTIYSFEPVTLPAADPTSDEPQRLERPPSKASSDPADVTEVELPDLGQHGGPVASGLQGEPAPSEEDELERLIDEARAEAHGQGVTEGQRLEAERMATAFESLTTLLEEIRAADAVREKEAMERIAALATAIASHLVEREVRTSPDVISDLVRRAIAEFPVNEKLTIHLNPSDLALLSTGLPGEGAASQHLTSGQTVNWLPDPGIRSGGCLVEGGDRIVDARLSRILDRIVHALVDDRAGSGR